MSRLDEVKATVAVERGKVRRSIEAIFGSRVLLAVLTAALIAFGAHLVFAPTRLPTFSGFSLAAIGLPPLDFGMAGEAARDAADAAARQGAGDRAAGFLAANPQAVAIINAIGFGACAVLIAWTLMIQAASLRRGVRL